MTKYDSSGSSPNVFILLMKSVLSLTYDLSDCADLVYDDQQKKRFYLCDN